MILFLTFFSILLIYFNNCLSVSFIGGSFFEAKDIAKLNNCDAYIIKQILHDWNDENSLIILQNIK